LTDHQMNMKVGEEFGLYFARIPLATSPHIVHGNALELDWAALVPPERLSYLLGNPPFIGSKFMTKPQREELARACGGLKGHGILDYVTAWYFKAVDYIRGRRPDDPELEELLDRLPGAKGNPAIRVGFVSTNSITQGEQVGVLWQWMLDQGMHIHFAHRTFQWTNEARGKAAVHCVIIGFGAEDWVGGKTLFDYPHPKAEPHALSAGNINPYLVDAPDVVLQKRSKPLCAVPEMRFGNQPIDGGHLILSEEERQAFLDACPEGEPLIRRFVGSKEFINDQPRYCLWLVGADPVLVRSCPSIRDRLEAVRQFRLASKREATKQLAATPGQFAFVSHDETDYLLIPSVSSERRRYIPVGFMPPSVVASNLCMIIPGAAPLHFGIITSAMHMAWVRSVCGRLKSDFRYSAGIVYNNFPWPESVSDDRRACIEQAAAAVLAAREKYPDASLADLYDPLSMPPDLLRAHQKLDREVDAAYSRRKFTGDADRVAFLFERHRELAHGQ